MDSLCDKNGKLKQIDYTNSHKCIDNGVGDFDFYCPEKGKTMFVPALNAPFLKGVCCCGKKVERLQNGY